MSRHSKAKKRRKPAHNYPTLDRETELKIWRGQSQTRRGFDPSSLLADFGHWWHKHRSRVDVMLLLLTPGDGILLMSQVNPPSFGFCVDCADGQRRMATAEFPSSPMATAFFEKMTLLNDQGGGLAVALTLDLSKAYVTPYKEQVLPPQIRDFAYDPDTNHPSNFLNIVHKEETIDIVSPAISHS